MSRNRKVQCASLRILHRSDNMNCVHCGVAAVPDAKFCRACGVKFEIASGPRPCRICGFNLEPGTPFCTNCGIAVVHFRSNRRLEAPVPATESTSPQRSRQKAWSLIVFVIIGVAAADYWSVLLRPGAYDSPVHVVETPQTVPATVTTAPAIETVARAASNPTHLEAAAD